MISLTSNRNAPSNANPPINAADLYCDLAPQIEVRWRDLMPGLMVAALGTLAAGFLADRYGAPLTLMALLMGLALNFLSADPRLAAGLTFSSQTLLRWGIVLVGLKVTLAQMVSLGPIALGSIALIALITIALAIFVAKLSGQDFAFGLVAGGAVAICGASAAMAIATTLGERRLSQERVALVLVGISALSGGAMLAYPIIAHQIGLGDHQAGFLLGASIHDVAQSLGAGFSFSPTAGQIATIVKLTRVALLAPLLAIIAWRLPKEDGRAKIGLPWFVIGFFLVAAVNSTGLVPSAVSHRAEEAASALIAMAVTAVAVRSPLNRLIGTGWTPLIAIGAATAVAFVASLMAAHFLVTA
jgi:uncharacterized integral membrane protein (TIGR00698 family)